MSDINTKEKELSKLMAKFTRLHNDVTSHMAKNYGPEWSVTLTEEQGRELQEMVDKAPPRIRDEVKQIFHFQ